MNKNQLINQKFHNSLKSTLLYAFTTQFQVNINCMHLQHRIAETQNLNSKDGSKVYFKFLNKQLLALCNFHTVKWDLDRIHLQTGGVTVRNRSGWHKKG